MDAPLFNDVIIIFLLSVISLYLCHRIRLPEIVGFLLAGVVAGPHGFRLIKAVHEVELLAEIGVVLLLFTIGIEFSLRHLVKIGRLVLKTGTIQVGGTILAIWLMASAIGIATAQGIFLGFLAALSSTAIVIRIMQARGEIHSPQGRITLATLIYQDVMIVPMMLVTPMLAQGSSDWTIGTGLILVKAAAVIAVTLFAAKYAVPILLKGAVRTRSRELFLLSVLLVCSLIVWVSWKLGLSLALGAFLAGLIISESEYSHQAIGSVLPFRDVFTSFFFVSIGMLLDLRYFITHPGIVLALTLAIIVIKALVASATALILRYPLRTAILVGLNLAQIGEFSFILSRVGVTHGLLSSEAYQAGLAAAVLTMALTPLIAIVAPMVADHVARIAGGRLVPLPASAERNSMTDHLIIVGFGLNGRHVAEVARAAGIVYRILEMDPDLVRQGRQAGEPIRYGDATQEAVLEWVGLRSARVLVAATYDPAATQRLVDTARRMNPQLHIIVRTRVITEVQPLLRLGANEVIPEDYETSIEIIARVLTRYLIPRAAIKELIGGIRAGGYEMMRGLSRRSSGLADLKSVLPETDIVPLTVAPGSPAVGQSLSGLQLRGRYGVTLLAVRRAARTISNPDPDFTFEARDYLLVMGRTDGLHRLGEVLEEGAPESTEDFDSR